MGKQVTVQVVDDLDGAVLDEYETVRWSLDGKHYEFDTSPKNAEKFRTILAKYRDASRKSTAITRTRVSSGAGRSREQSQAIRQWANDNGFEVSERGRIRAEVIDAFDFSGRRRTRYCCEVFTDRCRRRGSAASGA